MDNGATAMGDVRRGSRRGAVSNGIQEICHVLLVAALAAQLASFRRPGFFLRAEERAERPAAREDHIPFGSVKDVAIVEAVHAVRRERIVLVNEQPAIGVLTSDI